MEIRELSYEDLEAASLVLWKSFYYAEKDNTSVSGMERFRDLTSPVSLSINSYDGSVVLYGVFDGERLLAVGALKEQTVILMLYVHPDFWFQGIGGRLLSFLEEKVRGDKILLNASDCAVEFYKKHGYHIVDERREEEGLIFTPMKKTKKC